MGGRCQRIAWEGGFLMDSNPGVTLIRNAACSSGPTIASTSRYDQKND